MRNTDAQKTRDLSSAQRDAAVLRASGAAKTAIAAAERTTRHAVDRRFGAPLDVFGRYKANPPSPSRYESEPSKRAPDPVLDHRAVVWKGSAGGYKVGLTTYPMRRTFT